ncbi:oligosaccharide flippase family protein [Patescibacteria group bacterium]
MSTFIKKLRTDALYRNSVIFIGGSLIASIFGYLFHLAMGRMLAPADYAIIASLLAVLTIISVPAGTIQTVATRYTAQYKAKGDEASLKGLRVSLARKLGVLGIIITVGFMVLSPWVSDFLNIGSVWPVIVISLVFLFAILAPIYRGILQGSQRFVALSSSLIAEAGLKFAAGIGLVWIGLQVGGAIGAIVIGSAAGLLVAWFFARQDGTVVPKKVDLKGMLKYALPVIIVLLSAALLYNIDVILVKHYFSGEEAGLYAALSQLGKIIVFGTMAVAGVMFPMVAEKFERKEDYRPILWKSIGIVGGLSAIAVVIYFLAPQFVIGLLYGENYLAVAWLLGYVAVFMALYSVLNVLVQFFLSIKIYGFIYPLVVGMIAQIVLVVMYHTSLFEVIMIMNVSIAATTVALFVYYGFLSKKLKARR